MKAVRLYAIGDLRVVDVPEPVMHEGQVLVKVGAVGVCGSDIPRVMSSGAHHMPITIGHEFAGVICQVGPGAAGWAEGDRVTVAPLMPCYRCEWCERGLYHLCEDYDYFGSRCDGAMAEYVSVPARNLVRLPRDLPLEAGAQADPAATALHALERGRVGLGSTVAIYGMGPIGFYALQWARILGAARVIAVDVFDEKLELAGKLGATDAVNARQSDPVAFIREVTAGRMAETVLEFAALQRSQLQAIQSARKQGSVVLVGISHDQLQMPEKIVDRIMRAELQVTGSWNSNSLPFPGHEWTLSVDCMGSGELQALPLISHRYCLEDAPRVFPMLHERQIAFNKVMFTI